MVIRQLETWLDHPLVFWLKGNHRRRKDYYLSCESFLNTYINFSYPCSSAFVIHCMYNNTTHKVTHELSFKSSLYTTEETGRGNLNLPSTLHGMCCVSGVWMLLGAPRICTQMEVRAQCWLSFSILNRLDTPSLQREPSRLAGLKALRVCLCSPQLMLQGPMHSAILGFWHGCWGFEPRSVCWQNEPSYALSHLLGPIVCFLFLR